LDEKKITEAEKWRQVKQLLKEMIFKERRRTTRPSKDNCDLVVESGTRSERQKEMDFHSQEWTDRCTAIAEKCEQLDNMKISKDEKLRRTKQLLKELAFTDTKR
jgi:hypothetical protein